MSKSLGNVVDPAEQVEEYGADLPRFYQLRLAPPWEQKNYDETEIEEEIYRLMSVFWNTKEFYTTYVDDKPEEPEDLNVEDEWVLSRINSITDVAPEKINDGRVHEITRELEEFILNDLSRWYVKKVRGRIKQGDEKAAWTLGTVLEQLNKLMAPFTPHLTEKIYQDLEDGVSVHKESYPEPEERFIDEDLEWYMELSRQIVEKANKLRDEEEYNLRWPAKRLVISTDEEIEEGLQPLLSMIEDMVNVKNIEFGEVASKLSAKPDYSSLGPKFGGSADEVANKIEELEHDQVEQLRDLGEIELDGYDVELDDVEIRSETRGDAHSKTFEAGEVFIDLEETDELVEEAFVNEVIRAIQEKRKEAGLEVHDEIKLSFEGGEDVLEDYLDDVRDRMEVDEIVFGESLEYSGTVEHRGLETRFSFSEPVN